MASGIDEENATVNTGILNVTVTDSSQLLTQISAVLVLDVFHNWIPAYLNCQNSYTIRDLERIVVPVFVIDHVAISRRVDDVQPEAYTVLSDN